MNVERMTTTVAQRTGSRALKRQIRRQKRLGSARPVDRVRSPDDAEFHVSARSSAVEKRKTSEKSRVSTPSAGGQTSAPRPGAAAGRRCCTGSPGETVKMSRLNGPARRAARRNPARAPPAPTPEVGASQWERKMQNRPRKRCSGFQPDTPPRTSGMPACAWPLLRAGYAALLHHNRRNSREKLQSPLADGRQLVRACTQRTGFQSSPLCRLRVAASRTNARGARRAYPGRPGLAERHPPRRTCCFTVLPLDDQIGGDRQTQNAGLLNMRSIEKNALVLSAAPILSLGLRIARPQNSGGGSRGRNGRFAERNGRKRFSRASPCAGLKWAVRRTAARQNHPPIGEKSQESSRKAPPHLDNMTQNRKIAFSARLRKIRGSRTARRAYPGAPGLAPLALRRDHQRHGLTALRLAQLERHAAGRRLRCAVHHVNRAGRVGPLVVERRRDQPCCTPSTLTANSTVPVPAPRSPK